MYKSKQIRGFKPLLVNSKSINKNDSKTDQSTQISDPNSVRSTSRILNLLKKPLDNIQDEKVQDEDSSKKCTESDIGSKENVVPVNTDDKTLVFSVVIGKKSTRKHKVFSDDGILEVTGRSAILKDTKGNIIKRTTVNPANLEEGFRLSVDNKEIEIVGHVSQEVSSTNLHVKEPAAVQEPPQKKLKTSFVPVHRVASINKGLKLTYEPLVMPALISTQGWLERNEPLKEEEVSVDPCLASVLRPHQRQGIVFLYECIMGIKVPNYFGTILADEMGLGKTLQCITIIWTLLKKGPYGKPILRRVLIISPSSLCNNWNKEFTRWLGHHRICPYVVDTKNKAKDFTKQWKNSVMIISYEMLIKNQEEIEQIGFDLIICDEGHRLKNNEIKAAKFLQSINCKRRILLSGTPIQNDLKEFFALIDFVNPGILGSNSEYKNYYEDPIVASQCPNATPAIISLGKERAAELHEQTKSFILRRTQDTINKYLPPKHEVIVFCSLSDEQRYLYSLVTDTWFSKTILPDNNLPHLAVITALKKICNHAELFKGEKNEYFNNDSANSNEFLRKKSDTSTSTLQYSGKINIVRTLLRNLRRTNEKLVLISYYTQTLDLFEDVCNAERLKFLRLDGSTPSSTRQKIVEEFNSTGDNHKVFLLSAKAGGVGLNLPGASRLVLFDSDWNPASDAQAMARIWREGQKKDVYVYRLLTTGTIEEKIFQRQISKASLSETVVNTNHLASLKLSISELKDLFTLRTDTICLTHDLMSCNCDGKKGKVALPEESDIKDTREYQFVLEDDSMRQNLNINQLLEWEHYKQPIATDIMEEILLKEISDRITFIFKNSVLQQP